MQTNTKRVISTATLVTAVALALSACGGKTADPQVPTTTVGAKIDDTVITTKVKSALLGDPDVKSFDLQVLTRKGVVQLSGFVDSQAQIERAMAVSKRVEGVTSVENNVTMKIGTASAGNIVDDSVVTTKVKTALLGDPMIKSFDIKVVTRKGETQLSGFVDNKGQIDQALLVAKSVPGVTSVANEMTIKK